MTAPAGHYPLFPPGLWRRIRLEPAPGRICAALEDDVHRFDLRLDHDGERVIAVHARTLRAPWTACPEAADFLSRELAGETLADVARRDPFQHCTHLLDLAILSAAHASDVEVMSFDMQVADRIAGRTTAMLAENGIETLRWQLDDTVIRAPSPWSGKDLRRLSQWKVELDPRDAERAALLRRAVFVSGARSFVPPPGLTAAEQGQGRAVACFNYQEAQATRSTRNAGWRKDFSQGGREPLSE